MDELGGGERLAAEARDEARVLGQVLGQQLDRRCAPAGCRTPAGRSPCRRRRGALELVAVGEQLGHSAISRPVRGRERRRLRRRSGRRLGRARRRWARRPVGVGVGGLGRGRGLGRPGSPSRSARPGVGLPPRPRSRGPAGARSRSSHSPMLPLSSRRPVAALVDLRAASSTAAGRARGPGRRAGGLDPVDGRDQGGGAVFGDQALVVLPAAGRERAEDDASARRA